MPKYIRIPCRDCHHGLIPVETERGLRYKLCDCDGGSRLVDTEPWKTATPPEKLINAILHGVNRGEYVNK